MKKISRAIILVFCAALILLSLSKTNADKIRGFFAAALRPAWEFFSSTRLSASKTSPLGIEVQRLLLENQMLKKEIKHLKDRFGKDLEAILDFDFQIVPARVIFRSPAAWDHSVWINVGERTNQQLGKNVILKNSPVVVGKSVVGVVDYVGNRQSRVRLITDSGLPLSVRVYRTNGQTVHRLAKGELQGGARQVRSNEYLLRGVGFNYDFCDEEGPARDLRSGKPADGKSGVAIPLVKGGDLLVTSGLDGVFPAGLHVGRVHKIFPLKEGDYYFELEAKSTVDNLDDLSAVFVLEPLGYNPADHPDAW